MAGPRSVGRMGCWSDLPLASRGLSHDHCEGCGDDGDTALDRRDPTGKDQRHQALTGQLQTVRRRFKADPAVIAGPSASDGATDVL